MYLTQVPSRIFTLRQEESNVGRDITKEVIRRRGRREKEISKGFARRARTVMLREMINRVFEEVMRRQGKNLPIIKEDEGCIKSLGF